MDEDETLAEETLDGDNPNYRQQESRPQCQTNLRLEPEVTIPIENEKQTHLGSLRDERAKSRSRSRSHDQDQTPKRAMTRIELEREWNKLKIIDKIIEIELRMNTKVAKLEEQHQDTVLWFTEEIRKVASANKELRKIILKLTRKVEFMEENNQTNTLPKE